MTNRQGKVHLVGAGPGDPALITIRGLELLTTADVVLYDRLVDQRLVARARDGAELIDVGKARGDAPVGQNDINRTMIDKAKAGNLVVRLKGGDPFVFGRGGEEALALARADVPFEVVPGVTSAVAVPAYAGIPITHRGLASSVTIVTGSELADNAEDVVDWGALARTGGTIVVLMGWDNLNDIVSKLVREGRPPETPVALIEWGTEPYQKTIQGTLKNIVNLAGPTGLKPPVVIVIGDVVRLRDQVRWFENQPLHGKRVLVTRTQSQADVLSNLLALEGALPIEVPTIRVEPIPDYNELDNRLQHLDDYDWIVFASTNAVAAVFWRMDQLGLDTREFHSTSVVAIGSETAATLRQHGIVADFIPEKFVSESIVDGLKEVGIGGARVLYPRSQTGRDTVSRGLVNAGAEVDQIIAYVTVTAEDSVQRIIQVLSEGVDVIVFTSSSTVNGFVSLLRGDLTRLKNTVIACIGPVTAHSARNDGLDVDIIANPHTIQGLVDALLVYYSGKETHD